MVAARRRRERSFGVHAQQTETASGWTESVVHSRGRDGVEAVRLDIVEVVGPFGISDRQLVLCPAHPDRNAGNGIAVLIDDAPADAAIRGGGRRSQIRGPETAAQRERRLAEQLDGVMLARGAVDREVAAADALGAAATSVRATAAAGHNLRSDRERATAALTEKCSPASEHQQ